MKLIHPSAIISPHARIHATRLIVGKNSRIDDGAVITGDVEIGDWVHIGAYVVITGRAGVKIGNYSAISMFCTILTGSDDFSGRSMAGPTIPVKYKPHLSAAPVNIERNVLIGAHSTVMPGVTLREGVAIGAYSMVKADCDENGIYSGIPAMFVKPRDLTMWDFVKELESE